MVYTINELQNIVAPIAARYRLKAVYVFGSYARGEAREDSDVDLLIDDTDSGLIGFAYGGLYSDLEEAIGKTIDMVIMDSLDRPTEYESQQRFRDAVRQERRKIYAAA